MSIKSFIKEHLLGHHISDDVASFVGGGVFANIFTTQFASHILEVAIIGLIGGAAGFTAGMVYMTTGSGSAPLNAAGILMIKQ